MAFSGKSGIRDNSRKGDTGSMNTKRKQQQSVWDAINVSVDIDYYIRLLWARKWPILAFAALTCSLMLWYFSTRTPEYLATSSLLIESHIPRTMTADGVYNPDSTSSEYFTTQVELLRSRKLISTVIDKLDLWRNPELAIPNLRRLLEFHVLKWLEKFDLHSDPERIKAIKAFAFDRDNILYSFSQRLDVIPVRHSKLIKISYRSMNAKLAAQVANSVAKEYIALALKFRDEVSELAYKERYAKLREASVTVEQLENRLASLVGESAPGDAVQSEEFERYNRQYLTEKLVEEKLAIEKLQARLRQVRHALDSPNPITLDLPELGAGAAELRQRYFEAKYQRELLSRDLQPEHPLINELDAKMASIQSLFTEELGKAPGELAQRIKDAQRQHQKTRAELNSLEKTRLNAQSGQREAEKLQSELEKNEKIRQRLRDKVEESLQLKNSLFLVARVIDKAEPPLRPLGPRKITVALGSLILGALFASMFIVFRDLFDTRVRYAKRFELASGIKNLACIPTLNNPMKLFAECREASSPKPLNRKERAFFESFRTLKTNLVLELIEQRKNSILIASSAPNEGKSTTSLWLANAFASSEKVLLIDADIRRHSLTSDLGCADKKGLINALTNGEYEVATVGASQGIFDFLPAGSAKVDPAAYFSVSAFDDFMENISCRYDRVIIDTSPVCAVSDAVLLARQVGAVVLVTRSAMTQQKVALQSIERLTRPQGRVVGFVITDIEEKYYRHLTDYAVYRSYDKYYANHDL